MCKETFLRLPEEKRARILNAAWDEFTTVSFVKASINRIIRRADIPRGSFYQYFDDKSDLFQYLMSQVRDQLMERYCIILDDSGGDIFRAILTAYDRFWEEQGRGNCFAPFAHCIQLMRINPGMDLEPLGRLYNPKKEVILETFLQKVDLTPFRRSDRDFLTRVSCMTGMCFIGALMDSLMNPEEVSARREELSEALDILRRGSYRAEVLRDLEKGAVA